MKKGIILIIMLVLLVACGSNNTGNSDNNEKPLLNDGTYTSTTQGYGGDMVVETTIVDGKIDSVEIVSHGETPDISDKAINELPETIVSEQSVGVDIVSGATSSSNAIIEAVSDAITQAGGNIEDFK